MTLTQGIYADIPMSAYLADPCPEPSLSAGCAKTLINKTPLHAQREHPRLGKRPEGSSKAADIGSAAHELLLGGSQTIAVAPPDFEDWRQKAAQNFRKAARANGQTPMLHVDGARLNAMVDVSRLAIAQFGPGRAEQTVIWKESNGIWCRVRPDWITDDGQYVIDYKTCGDADPQSWVRKSLIGGGYEFSAAHYLRGVKKAGGEDRDRDYLFLVQESSEPYACSWVGVSPGLLELGQQKMARARQLWADCLGSGIWPGYGSNIHWAEAPTYAVWDFENREAIAQEAS